MLEAPSGGEGQTWAGIAYGFAAQVASREFRRGDLAHLRRMDPDAPDAAAYWRLMAGRGVARQPRLGSQVGAGSTRHCAHDPDLGQRDCRS